MGRVRRYKKLKSVDPFAKRGKAEIDTIHDEPPNRFNERSRKTEQNLKKYENNLMAQFRKAARETVVSSNTSSKVTKTEEAKNKTIESRREGESMKTFMKRVRQATRETLRDELKSMTSTAQKRKQRLKERKKKRKAGKSAGDVFQEEVEFFGASETGHVRPSDIQGSRESFQERETIGFGERVERPPELKHKIKRPATATNGKGIKRPRESEESTTAGARFAKEMQKRSKSTESARREGRIHSGAGEASTLSTADLEMARKSAMAAYKALQKKRRADEGRNFSSL